MFPDRPVFLMAIDVHSGWVNSKALELAGVNAKTPDPVPGFSFYQRDPKTGEAAGWLVEGPAEQAVLFKLQPPSEDAVIAAMEERLPDFSAAGIMVSLSGASHDNDNGKTKPAVSDIQPKIWSHSEYRFWRRCGVALPDREDNGGDRPR
jgi:predicted amidohydrolase YtcJ